MTNEMVDVEVRRESGRVVRARTIRRIGGDSPVLYMHGTPESRLTVDYAGGTQGGRAGVFSFDRPGYGGSDFKPFSFRSIADDAEAVADSLGIGTFAVVGHSGGAPFALAMGALLPSRVIAIGVTSGPVPYTELPEAWNSLTEIDKRAAAMVEANNREEAAGLFRIDFESMIPVLRNGKEAVGEYLRKSLPADVPVLELPGVVDVFAASLEEGVRQGVQGCAWDNVAWVPTWDFSVHDVNQEVFLWYGSEDKLMPVTYGRWFEGQLSQGRLTIWDGLGHLGLFANWNEVFEVVSGAGSL